MKETMKYLLSLDRIMTTHYPSPDEIRHWKEDYKNALNKLAILIMAELDELEGI